MARPGRGTNDSGVGRMSIREKWERRDGRRVPATWPPHGGGQRSRRAADPQTGLAGQHRGRGLNANGNRRAISKRPITSERSAREKNGTGEREQGQSAGVAGRIRADGRADGTRWKIDAFIIARSFRNGKQREKERREERREGARGDSEQSGDRLANAARESLPCDPVVATERRFIYPAR